MSATLVRTAGGNIYLCKKVVNNGPSHRKLIILEKEKKKGGGGLLQLTRVALFQQAFSDTTFYSGHQAECISKSTPGRCETLGGTLDPC